MSIKRILIIDDEYRILEVTKIALEMMAGWEVLTASSAREGLSLAEIEQPDAILLDMMMPDMDGIATLEQLQVNKITQHIPVVLLTAKTPLNRERKLTERWIKGVIAKPYDPLNLANQIAEALGWEV